MNNFESISKIRKAHVNSEIRPFKYPLLWIRNKHTGTVHLYGTNSHDSLYIDGDGGLQYFNLQTGCGTGKDGHYEFVSHDEDGLGYGDILHLYVDEEIIN